MNTQHSDGKLTIELLVRSQAGIGARDKQQTIVETLEELKQREVIDDFVVRVCGTEICKQMPADDKFDGESVVSLVTKVQDWAATRGVALENVFREKTIRSSFVDEEYTVVKLPYLSLLVFEDGSLSEVYPCQEEGTFCPIEAHLQRLREREYLPVSDGAIVS